MAEKKICVAGAGLVGSLLSLYLAQEGWQVEMLERRPDMRRDDIGGGRSINLALSDRGWRALKDVGIADEIHKVAIPMRGRLIHSEAGELNFLPYGREGQAIYSVSRAGLNMKMMDLAESSNNVDILFDDGVESVDVEQAQVKTFSGKEQQYQTIFGTDGAFSRVRLSLMLQTQRFDYSQQFLAHGYKELTIPATKEGGWRIEKNALHIWPRGEFMLIALPNLDGSFTCTLFLAYEGETSFAKLTDDAAVKSFFREYFPDALELMPTLTEDFFANPTGSLVTVRSYPWHHDGNVLLMGDASHAIVPFYGQGMNSGFEDCWALGKLLKQYGNDWSTIFPLLSQQRKPNADAIAELALRNFIEMRDLVDDPHFLKKRELSRTLEERFPEHWIPTYSMVTFSNLSYAEALRRSDRQSELLEQLLAEHSVEEALQQPELEELVRRQMV